MRHDQTLACVQPICWRQARNWATNAASEIVFISDTVFPPGPAELNALIY